jgi:hypothetical protein
VTDEAAPDKDQDEPKNAPDGEGSSEGDDDPKQGLTSRKFSGINEPMRADRLVGEVDDGWQA